MQSKALLIFCSLILCCGTLLFAQESSKMPNGTRGRAKESSNIPNEADSTNNFVQIDKIFIIGNKKTKEKIITRELDIYEGQVLTLGLLKQYLSEDSKKIYNTSLFNSVDTNIIDLKEGNVDVIIRVAERWYFFPSPIFNLADRNFTEWWVNQGHDFSRVEWGLNLRHFNFRGRNENVGLTAQFGYTKLFSLIYIVPYLDKSQKVGFSTLIDYSTNKDLAATTENHRLQFINSDNTLRNKFQAAAYLSLRPSFYNFHRFGFWYSVVNISDTVAEVNPNYLLNGDTQQQYFGFTYRFRRDLRDVKAYPLDGLFIEGEINKYGLGLFSDVDYIKLSGIVKKYFDLGKGFYQASNLSFSTTFPDRQPYRNYNGLGFDENFMRGYEVYVIEGQHFIMNNNTFKKRLLHFDIDFKDYMPIREFRKMPVDIYLTTFYDHGYVTNYPNYEMNDRFTDEYLYGYGAGIDLVTFYDTVLRWEYSINKAGESGFRLNVRAAF